MLLCGFAFAAESHVGGKAIDLNSADAAELSALYGIGDAKAKAIIAHRREHGPFKSVDAVVDVKGIGSKLLERNRARLTVGGKS